MTMFHTWPYGRFIKIQSNFRSNKSRQGSNFLGGSFSNRDNVRAPIQFRREGQPQHLKRWFFLKNRPIHFYINSTSVIRPVKWNQLIMKSITRSFWILWWKRKTQILLIFWLCTWDHLHSIKILSIKILVKIIKTVCYLWQHIYKSIKLKVKISKAIMKGNV